MTSRKELVRRAIGFQSPERIPIWFVNCDQTEGDAMVYHLSLAKEDDPAINEWGYELVSLDDGTMGHPTEACLPDWNASSTFEKPAVREAERMAALPAFLDECGDRYRLASLDLSGFTVYSFLRGFENSMMDFATEPERFAWLMTLITDFECEMATLAARRGFDGLHFADDWGTQTGLMVSPELWRKLFKPRYRRQFAHCRQLGLDVWYHCCGNFTQIAEDFHQIGVDVLNIAQPNVVDTEALGRRLKGRQCFLMPISYQTVSISGSADEIHAEAERLYKQLGTEEGGFIGYVEEYGCMGMPEGNYRACQEAFRRLRPE